jgi:hypothetical protein
LAAPASVIVPVLFSPCAVTVVKRFEYTLPMSTAPVLVSVPPSVSVLPPSERIVGGRMPGDPIENIDIQTAAVVQAGRRR